MTGPGRSRAGAAVVTLAAAATLAHLADAPPVRRATERLSVDRAATALRLKLEAGDVHEIRARFSPAGAASPAAAVGGR